MVSQTPLRLHTSLAREEESCVVGYSDGHNAGNNELPVHTNSEEIFWDCWEGGVAADTRNVGPLDIIYKSHLFVKISLYNEHKKPRCDKCHQRLEDDEGGGDLVPD